MGCLSSMDRVSDGFLTGADDDLREVIRKEWRMLVSPDVIEVSVGVRWFQGICLPDDESGEIIWAKFRRMTCKDYWDIEKKTSVTLIDRKARMAKKSPGSMTRNKGEEITRTDYDEMRRLFIKHLLIDWSLDIPLDFDDETGWLTDECYDRVGRLPAPLLVSLISSYEDSIEVTKDDEAKMERQSAILFSKTGNGVQNACEGVGLFCVLGNFWDKFGLNRFSLSDLSYREYLLLRIMSAKENEALSRRMKSNEPSRSKTMIAGAHGTRPSRGIRIPD